MIRAKRNRVKTILASMVANSPWNKWRWQLLWFYFRRWKNWVESGGNRKRWQLWCQSCFRVSKGGARALDRKWQIDLQVQCLCNKSVRKMLPHPPAFLHGALFRTAYAESDNATATMLPQCMRRHAAHPPVQSTRIREVFSEICLIVFDFLLGDILCMLQTVMSFWDSVLASKKGTGKSLSALDSTSLQR